MAGLPLLIPKLAVSMQEGMLAEWFVEDGGPTVQGQPLYALEIEKTTMEIQAPATGILRRTGIEGEIYQIGDLIGEIA